MEKLKYLLRSMYRSRMFLVALIIVSAVTYANAYRLTHNFVVTSLQTASATSVETPPASTPTTTPAVATTAPTSVVVAPPQTTSVAVAVPFSSCTPIAFSGASAQDMTNAPAGLNQIISPARFYQIYGNTPAQIRSQISACAPRQSGNASLAEFTAQTAYSVSWGYEIASNGEGSCHVINARIGMHVQMVLPSWQPAANAQKGLSASWQTFISNLTTHENGHATLDQQYASKMLSDLQNTSPSSCQTIQQSINATMNNDTIQLNQANDAYDTATNHGATQGAVLPQ